MGVAEDPAVLEGMANAIVTLMLSDKISVFVTASANNRHVAFPRFLLDTRRLKQNEEEIQPDLSSYSLLILAAFPHYLCGRKQNTGTQICTGFYVSLFF